MMDNCPAEQAMIAMHSLNPHGRPLAYFLQLFNYARNYRPDDAAKQDMAESRKLEAERRRRRS